MANIKPFKAFRPTYKNAYRVSSLPYDVMNTEEARVLCEKEPLSFMKIDRAEVNFENTKFDDPAVYEKAKELIEKYIANGLLVEENESNIYLYELTFQGKSQRGIVCLSDVEDYKSGVIKIHEYTLKEKEADRTNHIDVTNFHTGPIFLLYRSNEMLKNIIDITIKNVAPIFDFTTDTGVRHRGFKMIRDDIVIHEFKSIKNTYIADGHHRAKSAVNVYDKRLEEGRLTDESRYFLSVIFDKDELNILDYNRHIKDLCGNSKQEFMDKLSQYFTIEKLDEFKKPKRKYEMTLYIDKTSYKITVKPEYIEENVLDNLDVSLIQKYVFEAILGITDVRADKRLGFVGGIRDSSYLLNLVDTDGEAAIFMYHTDIDELIEVADNNQVMPPKSTWFEPKLHSGLFLHKL